MDTLSAESLIVVARKGSRPHAAAVLPRRIPLEATATALTELGERQISAIARNYYLSPA
jgi:hypothetical protein